MCDPLSQSVLDPRKHFVFDPFLTGSGYGPKTHQKTPSRAFGKGFSYNKRNCLVRRFPCFDNSLMWPLGDLNPRPTDYESAALTN